MSIKAVGITELLKAFEGYVTSADLLAARLLSNISLTITKKRLALKMNQTEFSKHLGVSQGMVSKWESKNYNYTIEGLATICDKLDMELDIVMTPKKALQRRHRQNSWETPMNTKTNNHESNNLDLVA